MLAIAYDTSGKIVVREPRLPDNKLETWVRTMAQDGKVHSINTDVGRKWVKSGGLMVEIPK